VPMKVILPDPYQARKTMEREAIRNLAEELKASGLWPGSLRGRMKGSHVELCYGHRRLAALKHLGWDKVEVEVDELTDEEMALQGLAENFQREGLSDIEKAQGLHTMVQLLIKQQVSESDAMKRVSKFVGLSEAWIRDLLSMLDMEGTVQRAIRDRKIAGRTALEAHRFGGKQMVATAVIHKLPVHKISAIAKKVRSIPDADVRDHVRKEVMKGKLVEPERVEEKARKLMKGRKVKAPEDLDRILADWTYLVKHWNEKADELLIYKRFFGGRNVGGLKSEASKLVRKLAKLAE
ncbi:MAG: ParB/RepB/Spo0J family partition protein, partial [Planctomycetota bacterium]